ncbi:MAG: hypothetical protein KDJ36_15450 [Hyphomicrobiaceae bacterium]|nr:hypothetical protein [Hyphomicrobiaceae bacterium]
MTRASINRTLRVAYWLLGFVLAISLLAKLADHIPGLAGTPMQKLAIAVYDYLKDMALVLVTVVATYLAHVFQKRSTFVAALEREWRGIVATKNALYYFCEKSNPTADDYLAAFCEISATLDNMRIVYRNVGETDTLIGLYPYAPLHDMRRALSTLDPRKAENVTVEQRRLVRDAILQSFYALRENFLEELDLEEPTHGILNARARRLKLPGTTTAARKLQQAQIARNLKDAPPNERVDALLAELYEKEQAVERARANDAGRAAEPRARS